MRPASTLASLALVVTAAILALAAVSLSDLEEPTALSNYEFHAAKPQPKGWYHLDQEYDPWATDGIATRGSFTVERKVERQLGDKFWLVIKGKVGHRIRCSIRGFETYMGHHHYTGYKHTYTEKTSIVTSLLPALHESQHDTLTCNDLVTGERRYFRLTPWHDEKVRTPEPWETDQASQWMKEHGLTDFHRDTAPLHGTSSEARYTQYSYKGDYSPGEEFQYRAGHPPIYAPQYEEATGGHLSADEAKENVPYKQYWQASLEDAQKELKHNRHWRRYWDAWMAGVKHDRKESEPEAKEGDAQAADDTKSGDAAAAEGGDAAQKSEGQASA